jgi:hypothetical protein
MTILIYSAVTCRSGPMPKTGAIRRNEGKCAGYFRHQHASQEDNIPHVVTDNNHTHSMYALSALVLNIYITHLGGREIYFPADKKITKSLHVLNYFLCPANRIKNSFNVLN